MKYTITDEDRKIRAERVRRIAYRHGMKGTPEYTVWQNIKARCTNPNAQAWANYGGRGVRMCESWRASFESFFTHVGLRPSPKHEIDRIDNDGHYEPGNVRWALRSANARNRRTTRRVEWRGKSMPMAEAAELAGMPYKLVKQRIRMGWPAERALTERPGAYRGK